MNLRASLLVALIAGPAWCQTPGAEPSAPAVTAFDLRSDAVRKIVRETAATQSAVVRIAPDKPARPESGEIEFVPAPKGPPPVGKINLPPPPRPVREGPLSSLFSLLVSELLGIDPVDEVEVANDVLRCRVHKELKISPPGPDNCPLAD